MALKLKYKWDIFILKLLWDHILYAPIVIFIFNILNT